MALAAPDGIWDSHRIISGTPKAHFRREAGYERFLFKVGLADGATTKLTDGICRFITLNTIHIFFLSSARESHRSPDRGRRQIFGSPFIVLRDLGRGGADCGSPAVLEGNAQKE